MKKYHFFVVFATVLVSKICFGDIIIGNIHYVAKCVKITNVDDYPDISLIGYTSLSPFTDTDTYIISSSQCLSKGYGYGSFNVFALNKTYLKGKDFKEIKFLKDPNALPSSVDVEPYIGYMHDSIPISAIEQFYKIAGFTDSTVVIYKWKEIKKFNNGKPDLTETFTYNGEVSTLFQKIAVGVNSLKIQPVIEVYPNPTSKNVHVRINSNYKGAVPLDLITVAGKVVKSFKTNKTGSILDYDMLVANVAKGVYFVKMQFGKNVEYKKIVIK